MPNIERIVTHGTFELDGGSWEVDNNIWLFGDDSDVVVFDAATVADRSQYDKPHQYSVGFRDVIVNGKFALREGAVTSERPGRVIYGPSHQ